MIKLKRAYEPPAPEDGFRILVDNRWPCRVFKKDAAIDLWMKNIAPSLELKEWFHRDPEKWVRFRHRYWQELAQRPELLDFIMQKSAEGTVTLVYRAKDTRHNAALAIKEYLEQEKQVRKAA